MYKYKFNMHFKISENSTIKTAILKATNFESAKEKLKEAVKEARDIFLIGIEEI